MTSDPRTFSTRISSSGRTTIRQIADATGVHVSTVSRALGANTAHLVAEDVARRIRSVAEELGYRRNAVAAGLRTGRSRLVGVLAPDIADPGFPPILSGIAEVLGESGYAAIVADVGGDSARQGKMIDQLIAQGVDGLVLATVARNDPAVAQCLRAGSPAVLVNRADDAARLPCVLSDDSKGMRLAVEHLVGLGHRRIGHVAGPQEVSTGAARRRGFEAAIALAGRAAPPVACASAYTRAEGRAAALKLMALARRPTAIVAANDLLALGVYDALATLGLECPRDVSVVGHNDMPYVDMLAPPLTTVRIRQTDIGREAARILIAVMSGGQSRKKRAILDCELIVRASTAPPRSRN
ncbi:MAG: LacI family DNA-binding transcriptional regulator [Beijerinckiaceae bacterium]